MMEGKMERTTRITCRSGELAGCQWAHGYDLESLNSFNCSYSSFLIDFILYPYQLIPWHRV